MTIELENFMIIEDFGVIHFIKYNHVMSVLVSHDNDLLTLVNRN